MIATFFMDLALMIQCEVVMEEKNSKELLKNALETEKLQTITLQADLVKKERTIELLKDRITSLEVSPLLLESLKKSYTKLRVTNGEIVERIAALEAELTERKTRNETISEEMANLRKENAYLMLQLQHANESIFEAKLSEFIELNCPLQNASKKPMADGLQKELEMLKRKYELPLEFNESQLVLDLEDFLRADIFKLGHAGTAVATTTAATRCKSEFGKLMDKDLASSSPISWMSKDKRIWTKSTGRYWKLLNSKNSNTRMIE